MLIKKQKSPFRKWLKRGAITLFVIEAAAFVVSYKLWAKVNTERDTRKYLRDNFPSVLETYYRTGEFFDANSNIRQIDHAYWKASE